MRKRYYNKRYLRVDPKRLDFIKKRKRTLIIAGIVAAVLVLLFAGNYGVWGIIKTQMFVARLNRQIEKEEAKVDSLTREIRLLKTDSTYIEKVAREEFNMAGENEKLFIFQEKR
ncbi:MAG: hypothetical protein B6D65_00235 [candidate division Zixibacteria bacterium 4484_93]|nr:MAG: hypothetical protein B6D65_00235 [candidate division Zixibacteria bacterium 4484_93]